MEFWEVRFNNGGMLLLIALVAFAVGYYLARKETNHG